MALKDRKNDFINGDFNINVLSNTAQVQHLKNIIKTLRVTGPEKL